MLEIEVGTCLLKKALDISPDQLDGTSKRLKTCASILLDEFTQMHQRLHDTFFATQPYPNGFTKAHVWRRADYNVKTCQVPGLEGPRWSHVLRRVTREMHSRMCS